MAVGYNRHPAILGANSRTTSLGEGMLLSLIGLGVGLGGTYFVGRMMKTVLYQVNAIDPAAISTVTAVLLLSALLACYIPARRHTGRSHGSTPRRMSFV